MIIRPVAILAVISLLGGIAAWLPVTFAFETGPDSVLPRYYTLRFLPVSIAGSFGVGFPIALTVYFLAREPLSHSFSTVLLIAVLSSVVIALTAAIIFDGSAALIFGVPTLFATLTYSVLGWFWILRPMRNSIDNPPQQKEIG
ncbi:MAG: hypothetical protein AAGB23_01435 [Pseudomonadota bacterium]